MLKQNFIDYSLNFLNESEKASFIKKNEGPACTSIRYNIHKKPQEVPPLRPVLWSESGYYLDEKRVFTLDPLFHAGAYYVQEASSMFLEQFLKTISLRDNAFVLDLCASPGGKSTHLLNLLKSTQLLVSNEVIKSRVAALKENLIKWGRENVVITQNDSQDFDEVKDFFDLVVVDAPCSGEGMFRKDHNAINEWSLENVEICYKRQRRILSEITDSVKDGGYLIYSTCTYNQQEDEENIKWFLANYDYEEVKLQHNFTGVMDCEYGYKLMPHLIEGEGFYICCLRKKGSNENYEFFKSKHSNLDDFKMAHELKDYIRTDTELNFYAFKDVVKALNPYHKTAVDYLSKRLSVITAGLDIAELLKNKQAIPSHSLAMACIVNTEIFEPVALDKESALKFLKKELNDIDCDNGTHLASYEGISLGFFKKIQNRINNNYPQEWRIRMNL